MNKTQSFEALTVRSQQIQQAKLKRDNALDECGVGHDLQDRFRIATKEISAFIDAFTEKAIGQMHYDALTNVPAGILRRDNANGEHAIRQALVSQAGDFVKWDITGAILLCADILDDVNAHSEAKQVRKLAYSELNK